MLRTSGKWSNTLCSSRQSNLLIIPKNRTFGTDLNLSDNALIRSRDIQIGYDGSVAEEKASNTYTCPACGECLLPGELQRPGGVGGGTYCPKCQARVYFSFPHSKLAAVLSLLLTIGALLVMRVTSLLWFIVGTLVLWVPISMFMNFCSTRFKPATLKKWKPRRRTFFEWLYERDKPPEMFDK
jgi:endogenous inhibitor of DNA gyrase (YacG/DUF329 family)